MKKLQMHDSYENVGLYLFPALGLEQGDHKNNAAR